MDSLHVREHFCGNGVELGTYPVFHGLTSSSDTAVDESTATGFLLTDLSLFPSFASSAGTSPLVYTAMPTLQMLSTLVASP